MRDAGREEWVIVKHGKRARTITIKRIAQVFDKDHSTGDDNEAQFRFSKTLFMRKRTYYT